MAATGAASPSSQSSPSCWPDGSTRACGPTSLRRSMRNGSPARRRLRSPSAITMPATGKPWTAPAQPWRDESRMNLDRPFTTKTDWVYNRLRAEILDGALKPADRLRLTSLARRFETSEMPVREALRMLQRDGLVSFESHRGATVINLSLQRAAEIVAVRMHLEVLATAEAVPHHSPETLAELAAILERMDRQAEARQAQRFTEANRRFHTLLYQPGPNRTLTEEIQVLWDRVW